MAAKATLNVKNLEGLGAKRLAELLLELSEGDATAKRRLRLELAGTQGAGTVAKEVRKRLVTIGRANSLLDAERRKALKKELEGQRRVIAEKVAPKNPDEAMDLLWRLLELSPSLMERAGDGWQGLSDVLEQIGDDLAEVAGTAGAKPRALADRTYTALLADRRGRHETLIEKLAPAMGEEGLAHLEKRFEALAREKAAIPAAGERDIVGWGPRGPVYAHELEAAHRRRVASLALQTIADIRGDVEAFIALFEEAERRRPDIAAAIAARLHEAGRAEEALATLDGMDTRYRTADPSAIEHLRCDILEALGRGEEAQGLRWQYFERRLDSGHLRRFLKGLPDFDDIEAENRAIAHAMAFANVHAALAFLVTWPALDKAAELVLARRGELDGDRYELLTPAAEALEARQPLAATVLLRAMIDFALEEGRNSRYRHAARHLRQCTSLAATIGDFGPVEPHDQYCAGLRKHHARKSSFWREAEPD